jgi:hypothetical protein
MRVLDGTIDMDALLNCDWRRSLIHTTRRKWLG